AVEMIVGEILDAVARGNGFRALIAQRDIQSISAASNSWLDVTIAPNGPDNTSLPTLETIVSKDGRPSIVHPPADQTPL
ncbi:hypothetical protein, partial [Nocardia cyriacigeorgica]